MKQFRVLVEVQKSTEYAPQGGTVSCRNEGVREGVRDLENVKNALWLGWRALMA